MDQNIVKFYDLKVEIMTLQKELIFREHYKDTITLNVFDDYSYNANLHHFKSDLIPILKEINDSILINYSLKTIDTLGKMNAMEKQNLKYVRTRYKRFGSFF